MPSQSASRPAGINSKEGVTLEKYIDTRCDAIEHAISLLSETIDKATGLQRQALEARLELLNEYKGMADARDQTFITKVQFAEVITRLEGCIKALEIDVDSLQITRASLEGKASQSSVSIAYLIAAVSIVLSVVSLIMAIIMG